MLGVPLITRKNVLQESSFSLSAEKTEECDNNIKEKADNAFFIICNEILPKVEKMRLVTENQPFYRFIVQYKVALSFIQRVSHTLDKCIAIFFLLFLLISYYKL